MIARIFLAGEFPPLWAVDAPREGDYLIAADAGYQHLMRLGLTPHLLVGDFDSLSSAWLEQARVAGVTVNCWPEAKDFSDGELAVQAALAAGCREAHFYGALGGNRFDHLLGNIGLLVLAKKQGLVVYFYHGNLWGTVITKESITIQGKINDIVSLLPLTSKVQQVTAGGLRYPLQQETLYAASSRSLANRLAASPATIAVERGLLLVMHYREL
ncbi:MAG: thiamine diphosphokinase [Symbiobacteriaceae bacterium]|nr:thiamine diphosphokinase [Symbiobacteriaceae bacterium]